MRVNHHNMHFWFTAILLFLGTTGGTVVAQQLEDVIFLEGRFDNPSYTDSPTISPSIKVDVMTSFSGHMGPVQGTDWTPATQPIPLNTPSDPAGHYLLQSAIGCPVANTVGWVNPSGTGEPGSPRNAAEALTMEGMKYVSEVKKIFESYYANKEGSQDPMEIYLAYDYDTQYGTLVQPASGILFDTKAANAAKHSFFRAWNINPAMSVAPDGSIVPRGTDKSVDIRSCLLDISYYLSAALIMQGNLCMEKAYTVRFLGFRAPSVDSIDDELKYFGWTTKEDGSFDEYSDDGAWKHFTAASKVWTDLFASPIQRAYLVELGPQRSLSFGPQSSFGQASTAPPGWTEEWPPLVVDGYKDAASMMRAIAQRAKIINEVARRLVLKLQRKRAAEVVEALLPELADQEGIIRSIIFANNNGELPEDHENKYPGLAESFLVFRESIDAMGKSREMALNERLNPLGFDKDVSFVIPGSIMGQQNYTYDYLSASLMNDQNTAQGTLADAVNADNTAMTTRTAYKQKASEFLDAFDNIGKEYDRQLVSICGSVIGDPLTPNLENPAEGQGLLDQQIDNVQLAVNAIERANILIDNVYRSIEYEQDRVEDVNAELVWRAEVTILYGEREADLTEEISDLQGKKELASSLAAAASTLASSSQTWWSAATGGIAAAVQTANGIIQKDLTEKIGEKQAEMARLRADKEAQFYFSDARVNDINSINTIKNKFLELRTLAIDLIDAEIRLGQEMNRLARYAQDVDDLVIRRDRSKKRLLYRHFADPTFRIELTASALSAEEYFKKAQIHVFQVARALEYKWPLYPNGDSELDLITAKVIRARVAKGTKPDNIDPTGLTALMQSMKGKNNNNNMRGFGWQPFYWNFSLRKDALAMTSAISLPDGSTRTAVQQFQDWLLTAKSNPVNLVDRSNDGVPDAVAVPFSTVKFDINNGIGLPSQTLRLSDSTETAMTGRPIFDSRLWDDKIDLVHVNIIGDNPYAYDSLLMPVELWYGGTSFVHTCYSLEIQHPDPLNTKPVLLDFIAYPCVNWVLESGVSGSFGWKYQEYRTQAMSAKLTTDSLQVPLDVITTVNFRELPTAATSWKLLLPLEGTQWNNIRDIEIIIIHKARTRPPSKTLDSSSPSATEL